MRILLVFLIVISCSANGQGTKEFEGIIRYKHRFQFTGNDLDTVAVKDALGESSVFYYKNGNYKWIIYSKPGQTEYFDTKTQTVYFSKPDNDTLFRSEERGFDDSLIIFRKTNQHDSVCGYLCNVVETVSFTKATPDLRVRRVLFYSDSLMLSENRFYGYRTYGSDKVFKMIKSWPLRIQLEGSVFTFITIFEAVEVIPTKLAEKEVYLPSGRPIKALSY